MVLARLVETDGNGTHQHWAGRQIFFFFEVPTGASISGFIRPLSL